MNRICSTCKESKPMTEEYFYKHKGYKGGLRYECKECFRARERKRYAKNAAKANQPQMKQCSKCGSVKPATTEYFYAEKNNKDGLRNDCKACKKTKSKKCYQCGTKKPATLEYYYKSNQTKDGLRGTCKDCMEIMRKQRRRRNREEKRIRKLLDRHDDMRSKYKVGQQIKIRRQITPQQRKTMKGWIAGVYDHFILVSDGKYRECFTYSDIATGEAEIRQ